MKKILSVILAISLLAGLLGISVSAADTYPESDHDYANNTEKTWTYEYPETVAGLEIVFSDDCYVEPYNVYEYDSPLPGYLMTDEVMDTMQKYGYLEKGDEIEISDDFGYHIFFTGDELAGQTINVTGGRFTITLRSDSSVTGYGFKIESISESDAVATDGGKINFLIDGKTVYSYVSEEDGEVFLPSSYRYRHYGDKALVGWKADDGKEFYYNHVSYSMSSADISVKSGEVYNLTPIYCKLGLNAEETFSFTNSGTYFDHDFGGYVYTKEDFRRQFIDWISTFGLSPAFPLALAVLIFITAYWPEGEFYGSCCGFAIAALLQHYGKIDLLSEQGVENVRDLKPTDELQSTINFYNNAAIAAHLVNHWGLYPASTEYTRQLKDLYATLEAGTPVYFEYYPSSSKPPMRAIFDFFKNPFENNLISIGSGAHGIVLTGAYTDADGNHVLLGYNNNSRSYPTGGADAYVINKDFTQISYDRAQLCGFAWNDDLSTFESFPTEGCVNPFAWHINFIEHIFELICHSITNLFN